MGWPYGCPPSTQLPYQNDYDMLSIENSIIKLLIEHNCDFTYKLHPDRADETLICIKTKSINLNTINLKKFTVIMRP